MFQSGTALRPPEDAGLGRIWLDKQFHGDLEATSRGQMLTAMTDAKGAPSLTITVVPDSGTEELAGLSGRMNIIITDGKHSYELEYTLDPTP